MEISLSELTTSIHHISRFLKSGIPICNSEVPDAGGRKITQTIAKLCAFHANAKREKYLIIPKE